MRRNIIIVTMAFTMLLLAGCPKPSINLPSPQININLPTVSPKVNVNVQGNMPTGGIPAGMTNQMAVQMFPYIFSYAFTLNGYWVWLSNFKPGQWTKFRVYPSDEQDESVEIEKAFLKKLSDGKEWWRVSYISEGDTVIYEALISPDRSQLLRLRVKVLGSEPGDVPVTQGTGYMQPIELTKESIEGATVGTETVNVPAGTFRAKHVHYITPGSGAVDWWYVESVPGGVVLYKFFDESGKETFRGELEAYGSGATTLLNSY